MKKEKHWPGARKELQLESEWTAPMLTCQRRFLAVRTDLALP